MLRPCASQLSSEQRSPTSKPSKKPGPPMPAPSGRPKLLALWPLGMPRPGGPLRQSHSKGNMAKLSETWRNKSSKRKAEAKLTSSPPVRLPYMLAQWSSKVCWWLLITFWLGQAPMSHPFILPQGTSTVEQQPTPAVPPVPVPKQSPRSKMQHPSLDPVNSMPLGITTSKTTSEGPPAPNGERSHLGTRCSSRATQKHSAGTLTW